MNTVYKYNVPVRDTFSLDLPYGAELLSFHAQHGACCLWALVDPEAKLAPRKFRLCGTGHPIETGAMRFIGTAMLRNGDFVFHLFELL